MQLGFIGLGKMGKGLVLHLLEQGVEVVVWNRSADDVEEVKKFGALPATSHADLVSKLKTPRIIWLMVPQGQVVDDMLSSIVPLLSPCDLVIDGGNSFYKDTLRRSKELNAKKIEFMDIGVSGGPVGARNGACLMIGGSRENFQRIEPFAKLMSAPNSYAHLGSIAAGHFCKMVHNGIEYGMMQAIAEGAAILKKSDFNLDLAQVFDLYNHQSVITSRLVDWGQKALTADANLSDISSKINATGEGEWTITTAKELNIPTPVISASFKVRQESATTPENFSNKMVSALRGQFGGHPVKK
jgi:6-phosphogluconate dehydrogenase